MCTSLLKSTTMHCANRSNWKRYLMTVSEQKLHSHTDTHRHTHPKPPQTDTHTAYTKIHIYQNARTHARTITIIKMMIIKRTKILPPASNAFPAEATRTRSSRRAIHPGYSNLAWRPRRSLRGGRSRRSVIARRPLHARVSSTAAPARPGFARRPLHARVSSGSSGHAFSSGAAMSSVDAICPVLARRTFDSNVPRDAALVCSPRKADRAFSAGQANVPLPMDLPGMPEPTMTGFPAGPVGPRVPYMSRPGAPYCPASPLTPSLAGPSCRKPPPDRASRQAGQQALILHPRSKSERPRVAHWCAGECHEEGKRQRRASAAAHPIGQ